MVAITALKKDDVLYDVVSQKAGNTTLRRQAVYRVLVTEVAEDHSYVMARWNGNAERKYREGQVKKWRRTPPQKD